MSSVNHFQKIKIQYLSYSQMQNDSPKQKRTQNDVCSQSQDQNEQLFPKINTKQLKESINLLYHHFSKEAHSRQLTNYCFRCHQPTVTQSYNQFRLQMYPELTEPIISNFFPNQCFIDLKHLGLALMQQNGYYPAVHMPPVPKNLKLLLDEVFETNGFFLFYPSYLQKHLAVKKTLFQSDKLDTQVAYFLAFCASSQMGCVYMAMRYLKRFKSAGGDTKWMTHAKYPQKYRHLLPLNRILARAIWQINQDMISDIIQNSGSHWSQNQLALCIQIMTFAHQNSVIALAMGLNYQEALEQTENMDIQAVFEEINRYRTKTYMASDKIQSLAEIVPILQQFNEQTQKHIRVFEIISDKKILRRSLRQTDEEVEPYMKEIGQQLTKQQLYQQICQKLTPLLPTHTPIEKRREHNFPTIDYSEYNFTFKAYPILNSLTQTIADRIMNMITFSQTMTRDTFGNVKSCNTKQFRKAMRYYAQNLCGYRHHQYNYKASINSLLTIPLKFFIRLLIFSPVHITAQVLRQLRHQSGQIQAFDIGHIAILVANTKLSLALTLAVKCLEFD